MTAAVISKEERKKKRKHYSKKLRKAIILAALWWMEKVDNFTDGSNSPFICDGYGSITPEEREELRQAIEHMDDPPTPEEVAKQKRDLVLSIVWFIIFMAISLGVCFWL